ncbi:hypothetical protein GEMRC1_006854 [Eukaryota sp. GEM-RC1]
MRFLCCAPKKPKTTDPIHLVELRLVLSKLADQFPHSHLAVFHDNKFLCQYDSDECPTYSATTISSLSSAANQLVGVFHQTGQPHLHLSTESVIFSVLPLVCDHFLVIQQQGSFWDSITVDGPEIENRALPFVQEIDLLLNDHLKSDLKSDEVKPS